MSRNTKIKDLKIVKSELSNYENGGHLFVRCWSESSIPMNRDAIAGYIDEPCIEACQKLYDLNIKTYISGIYIGAGDDELGIAYIGLVYDTLSEENKKIVHQMIETGVINGIFDNREQGIGFTISLEVNINSNSLVGNISDKLVQLANMFRQQDVLYGRKTFEELQNYFFSPLGNNSYRDNFSFQVIDVTEMKKRIYDYIYNIWYTEDDELFFLFPTMFL